MDHSRELAVALFRAIGTASSADFVKYIIRKRGVNVNAGFPGGGCKRSRACRNSSNSLRCRTQQRVGDPVAAEGGG